MEPGFFGVIRLKREGENPSRSLLPARGWQFRVVLPKMWTLREEG
jgi:hypothetical protein